MCGRWSIDRERLSDAVMRHHDSDRCRAEACPEQWQHAATGSVTGIRDSSGGLKKKQCSVFRLLSASKF